MINNLFLSVILGLVFIGTLYPLVTQAMGREISVGPPYFNTAIGPIALALAAIMTIGPMLRWRRDDLRALAGRIAAPALLSAAVLLLVRTAGAGHPLAAFARPRGRARGRGGQPRAALAPQPQADAALHLRHGDRPSRHRGRARRHGLGQRLHPGDPGRRPSGPDDRGRAVHDPLPRRRAGAGAELDRDRGAARGAARRRRAVPAHAAGAPVQFAADADQRDLDPHALGRPALRRDRRRRRSGPLAAPDLVEAVRHPDLGRRRAGRDRRLPRFARPALARAPLPAASGRRRWHEAAGPLGAARRLPHLPRGGRGRPLHAAAGGGAVRR